MAPVQLPELNLQGYSLVSNLDKNCRRGVCIYVRNSIGFAEIDISDFEAEESVWIEVKLREHDKLSVGCVYRLLHLCLDLIVELRRIVNRETGHDLKQLSLNTRHHKKH